MSDLARSLSAKEGSMETREQKLSRLFHHYLKRLERLTPRTPFIIQASRLESLNCQPPEKNTFTKTSV